MMTVPDDVEPVHVRVRDTRDRVIDLLGFGETAPLRDVELTSQGLVVPIDTPAELEINPGQTDVRYLLRTRDGSPVGSAFNVKGTGGSTLLATPPIEEDVTYRILARRIRPGSDAPRETYLHAVAAIKVGLDASLPARILAPLHRPAGSGTDGEPRVVDHDIAVLVEIDHSQPGVSYELLITGDGSDELVSVSPVVGNRSTIAVETRPMTEDAVLRVRATRSLASGPDQVAVLDIVMPLMVRADTELDLTVADAIVDHGAATTLSIAATQQGAEYRVWERSLSRLDFVYGDERDDTIVVTVPGEPDVQIQRVLSESTGTMIAVGSSLLGTGGDLVVDLDPITDDTAYIVTAEKPHDGAPSTVRLSRQVAVLTRPDPDQGLAIVVPLLDGAVSGALRVAGGQNGVFYWFRRGVDGAETDRPAFFPEPDLAEAAVGIGVLRIGVDWFIGRDDGETEPLVVLSDTAVPSELHVRAMKARTRVGTDLGSTATIDEVPSIQLESNPIASGSQARIIVVGSIVDERYRPYIGDVPIRRALIGNGSDLVFQSEPLSADTTIVVRAEPAPSRPGLAVERHIALTVEIT